MLKAIANDGKEFTTESPEFIAYKEEYPDVTDEAALGSVVLMYENTLTDPAETSAEEVEGESSEIVEESSDVPQDSEAEVLEQDE